jgi:hypothetical protein
MHAGSRIQSGQSTYTWWCKRTGRVEKSLTTSQYSNKHTHIGQVYCSSSITENLVIYCKTVTKFQGKSP